MTKSSITQCRAGLAIRHRGIAKAVATRYDDLRRGTEGKTDA